MKQVPVYLKREIVAWAIVDDEDYSRVMEHKWMLRRTKTERCNYPTSYASKAPLRKMYHFILRYKPEKGKEIDHIDGNGLNNQKSNLREVTHQQNHFNRGPTGNRKYKGVFRDKRSNRWRASCEASEERVVDEGYASEYDAALAYDNLARRLHGEYARLNFPHLNLVPVKPPKIYGSELNKKHISIFRDKEGNIRRYFVQITYVKLKVKYKVSTKTLDEAIKTRNAKLTELGIPIPD